MIRQSESIALLAPALIAAQAEMPNAPKETKGQAKAAVIYYSDLAAITDLVRPILARHGLCFTQFPAGGGDETVSVATRIIHVSGEWLEDELSMPCGGNGAQGVGSAITYAKRYSLMGAFGIAADDDDGAAASHQPAQRRAPAAKPSAPKVISEGQRRMMFAAAKVKGLAEPAIREIVARHRDGNESTADMPVAVFDLVLRDIEAGGPVSSAALDPHKTSDVTTPLGEVTSGAALSVMAAKSVSPRVDRVDSSSRVGSETGGTSQAARTDTQPPGVDDGGVAADAGSPAATTPETRWAELVAYADKYGISANRLKTILRNAKLVTGPAGLATDAEYQVALAAVVVGGAA